MRGVAVGPIGLASLLLSSCAGASYFPPSLFEAMEPCDWGNGRSGLAVMDEQSSEWYSSHLAAAQEPRLWRTAPRHEVAGVGVLRFTWLRSFDAPVIIRLKARGDGRFDLMAAELSGAGGYDPGRVAREVERRLSAEETAHLTAVLAETAVLEMTPSDDCPVSEDGEFVIHGDGARWIFEANGAGGYRFVQRHSHHGGPVRDLGLHLIDLTGWTYDRVY